MVAACAFAVVAEASAQVVVGAAQPEVYVPLLNGKRVALMSNHTGIVGNKHTLDLMVENGVNVTLIFSPEHGFRGGADAEELVNSSVDEKTGIPIASLYTSRPVPPAKADMKKFDVLVVDIQDVGARFYTYYVTMVDLMNACVDAKKEVMILDRPNPNGMYVDGPILDMKFKSAVGGLPIPVVHGLTLGEMARMAVGEKWLESKRKLKLSVVPCKGYTHSTRYTLPVPPSPNLRDMHAVYLYPSLCFFEATPVSVGRGTDFPFHVYGHPNMKGYDFSFTPGSKPGAKNPLQFGRECFGVDLSDIPDEEIIAKGLDFEYFIDAYRNLNMNNHFFNVAFEWFIGNDKVRQMIKDGKSAQEIKATWADDVAKFKEQRKPYLLYDE